DDRAMSPLFAIPPRGIIPRSVFRSTYPLSYALGLRLVSVEGNDLEAFDIDEVEKRLGAQRFASLIASIRRVLSCGHRTWPSDHPDPLRRNCEVHCIYAQDLEEFLERKPIVSGGN